MGLFDRWLAKPRQPDLDYAAKGFAAVALARANNLDVDLHVMELRNAERLLDEGATVEQAMSARWGGAYAIHCNLDEYARSVDAYEQTAKAHEAITDLTDNKYEAGAKLLLIMALSQEPAEYERFLRHIGVAA